MKSFAPGFLEGLPIQQRMLQTVRTIGEYRGKEDLFKRQTPQVLETLRQVAIIQSAESSNRIEGITAPRRRIEALVAEKTIPKNRSEQEIAGYRDVLQTIHANHAHMHPFEIVIDGAAFRGAVGLFESWIPQNQLRAHAALLRSGASRRPGGFSSGRGEPAPGRRSPPRSGTSTGARPASSGSLRGGQFASLRSPNERGSAGGMELVWQGGGRNRNGRENRVGRRGPLRSAPDPAHAELRPALAQLPRLRPAGPRGARR